jgi:hypothetical protein
VIGGDTIHVNRLLGDSAKEVSSPDDNAYLAAKGVNGSKFFGYFVNEYGVNTEATACSQCFS